MDRVQRFPITTVCLTVFGALYGAQRWKERPQISAEAPAGRPRPSSSFPSQAYPWVPRSSEAFRELMRESIGGLPSAPTASSPAR